MGLYSGFTKSKMMGPGGPGGPPPLGDFQGGIEGPHGPPAGFNPQHPGNHHGPPNGEPPINKPSDHFTFCRGIQLTGSDGNVQFTTIFPGVYQGRTNHIHFKVRLQGHADAVQTSGQTYKAGHTSHTGQIFFPETLASTLNTTGTYAKHALHRTTQAEDDVFNSQQGKLSIATIRLVQPSNPSAGLHAELIAAVDPTATPALAQREHGGPPPS